MGMVNYYSKTIPGYARVSEPLVKLTRKNQPFEWGLDQEQAFQSLKQLLMSEEVMAYPRTDRPYKLYTDASDTCIGGILVQDDDQGVERVIQYISHQLSSTQRKWSTIEKEAYAVVYCIDKLRAYLYGAEFTVFTDHKPLRSLFTKGMRNTKIQRWGVFLAEFGAKIRYIQGARNVRADLMSRLPPPLSVATLDTTEWVDPDAIGGQSMLDRLPLEADALDAKEVREAQQAEFLALFNEATEHESDYEIHDGLLYSIKRPTNSSPWYPRLVLPERFQAPVIDRCHKEVGHMAILKTLHRVREAYVWPGMRKTITERLKLCPVCIANQRREERPPMSEMPIPAYCMQMVGIDLIGPLVPSEQGNRYVVTVIDHLSGWAEAFPIPNKSSLVVETALAQEFLPRHGTPEVIITDRGLEFSSGHFRQYLADLGVDHRQSTPYHPETNGKIERFNRSLKEIITKLVNNQSRDWQNQLGNALYAYRNSVSASTGFTPFYLMYGRRGRLPLTKCLGTTSRENLSGRLSDLSDALTIARQNLADSRIYNRERINKRANASELKPGDTVVMKAHEKMTFTSGWDPQYEVIRVRGPVCWIRHQQTAKVRRVNRCKLLLVDPNIVWDELRPRPLRSTRQAVQLPVNTTRSAADRDRTPCSHSGSESEEEDEHVTQTTSPSPGNNVNNNQGSNMPAVARAPGFVSRYGSRLSTGRSTLSDVEDVADDPPFGRTRHEHVRCDPYSLDQRPKRPRPAPVVPTDHPGACAPTAIANQTGDASGGEGILPQMPQDLGHRYFTRSRGSVAPDQTEGQRLPPPPSPLPPSIAVKRPAPAAAPTPEEQKRQRLDAIELTSCMCGH